MHVHELALPVVKVKTDLAVVSRERNTARNEGLFAKVVKLVCALSNLEILDNSTGTVAIQTENREALAMGSCLPRSPYLCDLCHCERLDIFVLALLLYYIFQIL